jgi:SOS-response transcriptional repressor LexA
LTPKEARILKYIIECIEKRQRPPTLREIAKFAGSSSFGSTRTVLQSMEKKGVLKRTGLARGIKLNTQKYSVKVTRKK